MSFRDRESVKVKARFKIVKTLMSRLNFELMIKIWERAKFKAIIMTRRKPNPTNTLGLRSSRGEIENQRTMSVI